MSAERNHPNLPTRTAIAETYEGLQQDPPQLILVFDNYRGPNRKQRDLAFRTMYVRAELAAKIYKAYLYKKNERPIICSFAGEHIDNSPPGSDTVSYILREAFGIPQESIVTRKKTITTRTDIQELHAFIIGHQINGPVAIVTTDNHVQRTAQEWINHFKKKGSNARIPKLYIISPSCNIPNIAKSQYPPTTGLNHGFSEKIAFGLATIPSDGLRNFLQEQIEAITHPYTPPQLARIQKAARAMNHAKSYNRPS